MKAKGFTLIELMIVVAIIAVIAAIAIPSLLRSRIASNHSAAIAGCKTLATAQETYRRGDYDTDTIYEYATTLSGANSLIETGVGSGDLAFIDKAFGPAEGHPGTASPKAGYVFTVLTSQGSSATGGARDYIVANATTGTNDMTLGHAASAAPAAYDGTGRDTFIISQSGTIYQKDEAGAQQTIFDPTQQWIPTE